MGNSVLLIIIAALCSLLISFISTPLVRVFAYKVKALDIPKDDRRMHKDIVPRLGGLAIFLGFSISCLVFCEMSNATKAILIGGLLMVILGALDDKYVLNAWLKFGVQVAVAFVPVIFGQTITFIGINGKIIPLGWLSIPITVFWIIGLTNAINLIDGLDGLSCGISAICSLSLLLSSVLLLGGNSETTIMAAILAAACFGFLPFNSNPAKIFMGDTGALFLGYTMSVLSISGLYKVQAAFSFLLPLVIFGLPLFDTCWAFIRRIIHKQSPFKADRGHIHHKLIDAGFNVKQAVYVLYAACFLLGLSAVLISLREWWQTLIVILSGAIIFGLDYFCFSNPKTKYETGIFEKEETSEKVENKDKK